MKFVSFILLFFALFLTDCKKEKFTKEELDTIQKKWPIPNTVSSLRNFIQYVELKGYREVKFLPSMCLAFSSERKQIDFWFHPKNELKDFSVDLDKNEKGEYLIFVNSKEIVFRFGDPMEAYGKKDGKEIIMFFNFDDKFNDDNYARNFIRHPIKTKEDCQKALELIIINEKESHEQTEIFQHHSGVNYEKYPPGKNPGEDPNSETPPE